MKLLCDASGCEIMWREISDTYHWHGHAPVNSQSCLWHSRGKVQSASWWTECYMTSCQIPDEICSTLLPRTKRKFTKPGAIIFFSSGEASFRGRDIVGENWVLLNESALTVRRVLVVMAVSWASIFGSPACKLVACPERYPTGTPLERKMATGNLSRGNNQIPSRAVSG